MKNSYLWETASKLIAFDTVSNLTPVPCAEYIANELEGMGFEVQIIRDQLQTVPKAQIIAWIGPKKPGGMILSGHIDTVPHANQPGWTRNPIKLELDQNKIFGRGTSDMKVFIAHCLDALRGLPLKKLKAPIVCIFTCDEEICCLGAKRILPHLKLLKTKIPMPNRALIGEPTEFEIINTHKGITLFEIQIKGKAGHSSRPDLGINAITPVGKIIRMIESLNTKYRKEKLKPVIKENFNAFPYNHLHLAKINGGIALNMIPEECTLALSYRSLPNESPTRLMNELKSCILKEQWDVNIQIKNVISAPALPLCKTPELITALKKATGKTKTSGIAFSTDGGYFHQNGIESIICGPGSLKQAHQPNEHISLQAFLKGTPFVTKILQQTVF